MFPDKSHESKQQGMPWPLRKILGLANVSLHLQQKTFSEEKGEVTSILAKQVVSPGGFNSEDSYILDAQTREATVPIFGTVSVKTSYVPVAQLEDADFQKRIKTGGGDVVIREVVENKKNGWVTEGTWGFEEIGGERRFTRTSITTTPGDQTVARLVYDFKPE